MSWISRKTTMPMPPRPPAPATGSPRPRPLPEAPRRSITSLFDAPRLQRILVTLLPAGATVHTSVLSREDEDDRLGARARRAIGAHRGPRSPLRARHAARDTVPRRDRDRGVRDGLLLGRRADVLGGRRGLYDRRRLRGRVHREPLLRRG